MAYDLFHGKNKYMSNILDLCMVPSSNELPFATPPGHPFISIYLSILFHFLIQNIATISLGGEFPAIVGNDVIWFSERSSWWATWHLG